MCSTKVYGGLALNDQQRHLADKWLTFPIIWRSPKRLKWYLFAIAFLLLNVLGIRGADCFQNKDKQYVGYGMNLSDVTAYWIRPVSRTIYMTGERVTDTKHIHHIAQFQDGLRGPGQVAAHVPNLPRH